MRIPVHVQKIIDNQELHILATSSREGVPNIIYLKFLKVYNDSQILIANNKFYKTESNLIENPRISFVVMDDENMKAYQIKGTAEFHTDDQVFRDTEEWVLAERPHPDIYPKSAVILNVEEIYQGAEKVPEE